jgi:hypothetical protein
MATNKDRKRGDEQMEQGQRGQPQHEDAELKREAGDRPAETPERIGHMDEEESVGFPPVTPVAGP